ncbi:NAD(P)H-dependent oxidoreductase [Lagierella sp.]|uniref:NAD(P)H-dependent oxidoreductase n=1 Tax=Lagierella sp. TaxID=2849657 RepID=UPI00262EAB5F|nr:NAD(P)H-dependent oxidoreductase [Lagierella sp.]
MKKQKISIIYGGNPEGKCRRVYESILNKLKDEDLSIIDLTKSTANFELPKGYKSERDEKVIEYSRILKESDLLIFVYPLQWFNVPMKLKGFIDSSLWPKEAFSFKDKAYFRNGYFRGKKSIVVYTQGGGEWLHMLYMRSGLMAVKYPLKMSGVDKVYCYHIDNLNRSGFKEEDFEKKVSELSEKVYKEHIKSVVDNRLNPKDNLRTIVKG